MKRLLLAFVAVVVWAIPVAPAAADGALDRAGAFLAQSLDADGCAREPGGQPSANLTAWTALGLVAAARSAAQSGNCLAARVREARSATDIEIVILGLVAAGRDPRTAGGRDLVAALQAQFRGGRIGPTPASNQFGILALRAAGAPIPAAARATLMADQNADGSWPIYAGGDGDSNLTASGIAAAIAAGIPASDARVTRAVRALAAYRTAQGGYGVAKGRPADAQSTGWVLQGLAAVGRRDARAEAYLRGLQGADGAILYQRGTRTTPVWVTAQATVGLAARAFPLRP